MAKSTFKIKPGYMGLCAVPSCPQDATHVEYHVFTNPEPVPTVLQGIMEPVTGIWEHVCDTHCDPQRKHR